LASTTVDGSRVDRCGSVTTRQPLDARQEAFAKAIGHLLAEAVWAEIVGVGPVNTNEGHPCPVNSNAHLAGKRRVSVAEDRNEHGTP